MLYIGEYADIGSAGRGSVPIPQEPPQHEQKLEIGPSPEVSVVLAASTCLVRLIADADCAIAIGVDPDPTHSARVIRAGSEALIAVVPGSDMCIAVIAAGNRSVSTDRSSVSGYDSLSALLQVIASPTEAKTQLDALVAQAEKVDAAAADLRKETADNRTSRDDLIAATNAAQTAQAEAKAAKQEAIIASAKVARESAELDAKMATFKMDSDARTADQDKRETAIGVSLENMNSKQRDLADKESQLSQREADLAEAMAALTASQAAYTSRMTKLKELAG